MARLTKAEREKIELEARQDCLRYWIDSAYVRRLKKLSWSLGKNISAHIKSLEEINSAVAEKYRYERIIEESKKLLETMKHSSEFWNSEVNKMVLGGYQLEGMPETITSDMFNEDMIVSYIYHKYGESQSYEIHRLLKKYKENKNG